MAKYRGEEKSGKVGKVIYSSWHGRPYQRSMPESVANPRTEAQQAHRNAFAAISKLSSDLKEAHQIGLHKMAQKEKLDTYSVFKKINKGCCVGGAISYPHVIVSKGPVDEVEITSVKVDEQRVLHVTFDGGVDGEEFGEPVWTVRLLSRAAKMSCFTTRSSCCRNCYRRIARSIYRPRVTPLWLSTGRQGPDVRYDLCQARYFLYLVVLHISAYQQTFPVFAVDCTKLTTPSLLSLPPPPPNTFRYPIMKYIRNLEQRLSVDEPVAVTGQDDAAKAEWWPLSDLPHLAFDHYDIMQDAIALYKAKMNIT